MATGRFANAQALVVRQLADKGERATLRVYEHGTPADAAKPWEPGTPTVTSATVDAVFLGISETRADGNTLLEAGDLEVYIAASVAVEPKPNTTRIVRASGVEYEVVRVDPLNPNEDRIFYRLVVRR